MSASNTNLTGDQSAGRLQVTTSLTVTTPGTALDATAGKAIKDTADGLALTVNLKAPQSAVDTLNTTVAGKAGQAAVDSINLNKADKTVTDALSVSVASKVATALIGAPGGLATLDSSGKVPAWLLPTATAVDVPTVRQARTLVIPLDTADNGKASPVAEGNVDSIRTNDTYSIAAGKVPLGLFIADIVTTGVGSVAFDPSITVLGAAIDATEVGRLYQLRFWNLTIGVFVLVVEGGLVDVTAPVIQVSHMDPANLLLVLTPIVEAGVVTMLGTLADVTLGGADAGSFAKVDQSYAAGVHSLLLSGGPANHGTQLTTAFAAGFFRDDALNPNLSAARAATAVVINIPIGAPNPPTLAGVSATSTAQTLAISPGATDGGHEAAASFETQVSADNGQSWGAGATGTSLSPVISGRAPSTGYKYRSRGIGPTAGAGAWSAEVALATPAAPAGSAAFSAELAMPYTDGLIVPITNWDSYGIFNDAGVFHFSPDGAVGSPVLVNCSKPNAGAAAPSYGYSDSNYGNDFQYMVTPINVTLPASYSVDVVVPAGSSKILVTVFVMGYSDNQAFQTNGETLTATFADGSVAPLSVAALPGDKYQSYERAFFLDLTVGAPTTVTLKLSIPANTMPNVGDGYFGIHMVGLMSAAKAYGFVDDMSGGDQNPIATSTNGLAYGAFGTLNNFALKRLNGSAQRQGNYQDSDSYWFAPHGDQDITVVLQQDGGYSAAGIVVGAGAQDSNSAMYFGILENNRIGVQRRVSGNSDNGQSPSEVWAPVGGATLTLRARKVGDHFTFYVNGAEVFGGRLQDDSGAAGGAGFGAYAQGGDLIKSITVKPTLIG